MTYNVGLSVRVRRVVTIRLMCMRDIRTSIGKRERSMTSVYILYTITGANKISVRVLDETLIP